MKISFLKIVVLLSFSCNILNAQQLDFSNIKGAKKLTISGGLNFNNLYNSYVPVATQKYSYFVNGSINFNILGLIDIPLNLNFSNRKFNYSQPFAFNQFSITPKYKWATAYLGTNAMTFSPYTLNGHQFTGIGFDLMPDKWQISTMVGRLIKSTSDSTYSRIGYGLKLAYNPGKYHIGFSFLQAEDNPNSIPSEKLANNSLRPYKNVVLGFEGGINIAKIAQADFEYSNSFIADDMTIAGYKNKGLSNVFFNKENSVTSFSAMKAKISRAFFNAKTTLGLGYERVDPGYKTFGGYFFTDDLESYTVNFSQSLWENKINLSGNIGGQRDILATKTNGQSRLVLSTNLMVMPTEKLNITFVYSNFKGYTYVRDLLKEARRGSDLIPVDTLNFTQINRNTSLNISYNLLEKGDHTQAISLSGSVMDAANKQGQIIRKGQASQVYNAQASYDLGWMQKKMNISIGYAYNKNAIAANNMIITGPTFNITKGFFGEKLSSSLAINTLRTKDLSTSKTSSLLNSNLSLNYILSKKSKLLGTILLLKNSENENSGVDNTYKLPATIYTVNLGYNYQF
jgi:hypothetical protein